ncbi:MAG: hypothetical protein M3Y60_11925 [Bacteroidota bacterium]|nr:hypothetical protein [Bacteroidota bacterium]
MHLKRYFSLAFLLFFCGCTKFEDAEMTDRNTFVHFFSSESNYVGVVAELDSDGGYIVSGDIRKENGESDAVIIKTDVRGHKVWEKIVPNGVINAIKPFPNGYILVGDSIQMNTGALDVELSELSNSYARLLLMDSQGNITSQHITSGRIKIGDDTLTIDYHGSAFVQDPAGHVIMLGSYRVPGGNESTFVSAFDPANISDSLWYQSYQSLDHDLFNCRTLHVTPSSNLVWASSMHTQAQNLSREFVGVSQVKANSTFKTFTQFGERDTRNHSVEDLQRSPVGYCAIGTYTETNGSNGNIYFFRLDASLNVIPDSERYIDGEELIRNGSLLDAASRTSSSSLDEGLAIAATDDGYLLAGTLTSTPTVGNGGKDILLIKLDAFGSLVWNKLIGGSGDETVTSVRETSDKGFLICGSNSINGLSTIMLLKTDRNGNLDN